MGRKLLVSHPYSELMSARTQADLESYEMRKKHSYFINRKLKHMKKMEDYQKNGKERKMWLDIE